MCCRANTTEVVSSTSSLKHRAYSWLVPSLILSEALKSLLYPIKSFLSGPGRGLAAPGEQQYNHTEESHGPESLQQSHAVLGDDHLGKIIGDEGNLVSYTHKDEGADHDVKWRVPGDQDQNSLGVRSQPDVVLANEQLGETNSEYCKVQKVKLALHRTADIKAAEDSVLFW